MTDTLVRKAGVIGWPVQHSRSPVIHGYWLEKYGIKGSYQKYEVAPEQLERFIEEAKAKPLAGFNVTIPHKEKILPYLDYIDPIAAKLNAVNTVEIKDGKAFGSNTDGFGFYENLRQTLEGWCPTDSIVLVLGAGGAARGIVASLLSHKVLELNLSNRTLQRAQKVASDFEGEIKVQDWESIDRLLPRCDLIINTTSMGMINQPPLILPFEKMKPSAAVADIVYVPLWTELLKRARAHGHRVVEGLGMLIHQARPGFKTWFGVEPEANDELYRRLLLNKPVIDQ